MPEYHNPQQEPGNEKRLLLVFALTFLVMILFQPLFRKFLPQTTAPEQTKTEQPKAEQPKQPATIPPATAGVAAAKKRAAPAKQPAPAVPARQAQSESQTVVENDLYKITFSNRGGLVKSWILKKYDDDQHHQLELVNPVAAPKYGYPLSMWVYNEALRNKINSALYVPSREGAVGAPGEISFEYADQDVAVRKTFRFDHSYVVGVQTSVQLKGSEISAFPMWPAGFGDESSAAAYQAAQVEYQFGKKVERLAIKKISGGGTVNPPFNWASVTDRYFAAAFIPDDPSNAALVTLRNAVDIPKDPKKPTAETVKVDVLGAAVGNMKGATSERVFVGPKSLGILESVPVPTVREAHADLRELINFGFFGMIARPLFLWLKWTHDKIVSNWGWAIVLQTLIINLALLPLRITSMKSMLKMQRIQPQIKSIQEKYKKYSMRDPRKQEMNREIMDLQKKAGVSPVGGCLPMVIQLPFLVAYYSMLGSALDLRHATWLWIGDLAAPDPIYLLPIGIMISMYIMQRMTPQTGMDASQQKMMTLMMPVVLGVMSFNLAAGLCLYWSEGNLIGIVQQSIMNRTSLGREMREMAAKRARKKSG